MVNSNIDTIFFIYKLQVLIIIVQQISSLNYNVTEKLLHFCAISGNESALMHGYGFVMSLKGKEPVFEVVTKKVSGRC